MLALVLFAIEALVVAMSNRWWPVTDDAILVSGIHDVGTHTPLVGAFSRFGWRHPGPWESWLLAPAYRLGGSPNGVLVGVVLVNVVGVAIVLRFARRRGGRALLLLVVLAVAALARSLGPSALIEPWNPFFALVPFLAFLFVAWDLACGRRWSLPVAVGLASFVAQCHAGYVVPAAAVGLWSGIALLVWSRDRDGTGWGRVLAATAGSVVVLWIGPVLDQVRGPDGNLTLLSDFFLHGTVAAGGGARPGEVLGLGAAAGLMAREIVGAPWAGGPEPATFFSVAPLPAALLAIPALLLAAVVVVSVRAGDRDRALLGGTAAVAMVSAWVALSRTVGGAQDWILRFTWAVGLLVAVAVVWSLPLAVPESMRDRLRARFAAGRGSEALAVIGAGVVVLLALLAPPGRLPGEAFGPSVHAVADGIERWVRDGDRLGAVIVVPVGDQAGTVDAGVILELQRRGVDGRAGRLFAPAWPEHLRPGTVPAPEITIATGAAAIAELRARPDLQLIAEHPATTDDEQAAGVLPIAAFVFVV